MKGIKDETLDHLTTLHGWCDEQKMSKLYELVNKCAEQFPDTQLLSLELGVFGGRSLFPMAYAHKELKNGLVIGVDSWNNTTPLEGTNHPDNDKYWANIDIKSVFNSFVKESNRPEWSGFVKYLKGKSVDFASNFADESICILHQDSSHNIETITAELECFAGKVRTGGYWIADDTSWVEAKDGYAKLPSFGFELIEDYETWQVWKKVGVDNVKLLKENTEAHVAEAAPIPITTQTGSPASLSDSLAQSEHPAQDFVRAVEKENKAAPLKRNGFPIDVVIGGERFVPESSISKPQGGMQIGAYNIKPIALYLSDDEKWLAQYEHAKKYFGEQGVEDIYWLNGVHARKWNIKGSENCIYLLDGRPEEKFYVGDANVGNFISQYMAYNIMDALDFSHYLYLEGDCEFVEGWKEKLALALEDIPSDFDMLYVGSCCAKEKSPVLASEQSNLYHFPNRGGENYWHYYPLATHCYIIAKKAVKTMIETQRDCRNPTDISIARYALGSLNVYGILPRLAGQFNTNLVE